MPKEAIDEAVFNSEARTRAILAVAIDAIITINGKGNIESVNRASEKPLGCSPAELIGQNVNLTIQRLKKWWFETTVLHQPEEIR